MQTDSNRGLTSTKKTPLVDDGRYVICQIGDGLYGLRASKVVEMSALPELTPHPHGNPLIRGVARLRRRLIPVIDMRRRLGMVSLEEELGVLDAALAQREKEHLSWLKELKDSITEGRSFTLATNPHACAFGRWYDHYEPPNDQVSALMKRFGAPHARIHGAAIAAQKCIAEGDREGALEVAAKAQTQDFVEMAGLFHRVRDLLNETAREIVVFVELGNVWRGLVVDEVVRVAAVQKSPGSGDAASGVAAIGSAKGIEDAIYIFDLQVLLGGNA